MNVKLHIQTKEDKHSLTHAELADLLKKVAWHIETFPHRAPGLKQDLHDKDENLIGEYLLVARLED